MPYLFVVRTVLVGRENGTYNVDRARTWLRESGRQVQPPCRGVRQLRGSRPLIGWSPCRYVGVSAGCGGRGRRWPGEWPWWLPVACSSGAGVAVLHIHPGVLVGVVASFQRFPAPGGGGEQDECATRAPLHIHPGSQAQADGQIRMIPPFTDRGL